MIAGLTPSSLKLKGELWYLLGEGGFLKEAVER